MFFLKFRAILDGHCLQMTEPYGKEERTLIILWEKHKRLNVVEKWSYSWGFKFSIEKTKSVMFTRKRGVDAQTKMEDRTGESH